MIIYWTVAIVGAIVAFISRSQKVISWYFILALWSMASIRNLYMGLYDALGTYYNSFQSLSWDCRDSSCSLWAGGIGYNFLSLVSKTIFNNYQVLMSIVALPVLIAVGYSIKVFSTGYLFTLTAFICYYSLFYFYSYFLIRQYLALAFIIGIATPAIIKKQPKYFLIGVFLAAICHITALYFIIVYPLVHMTQYRKMGFLATIILSIVGKLVPQFTLYIISKTDISNDILYYYNFGIYKQGSGTFPGTWYVYILLLFLGCIFFENKSNTYENLVMWLGGIGSVLLGWSAVITEFYRLSQYFSFAFILLIPMLVHRMLARHSATNISLLIESIVILLIIGLMAYGFSSIASATACNPYVPMWDTTHHFSHWDGHSLMDPGFYAQKM